MRYLGVTVNQVNAIHDVLEVSTILQRSCVPRRRLLRKIPWTAELMEIWYFR